MSPARKTLILPLLLITVGVGWLLAAIGVTPDINWIWTLGLAGIGFTTFVVAGVDKVTVVAGSFFIVASFLSILRQTDRMSVNVEVPVLVIASGALLLIARHPRIPVPKWIIEAKQDE
jgi:hypothetical protein